MADYRLHGFAQSGNSYRVALMLEACHADWEPVFVDFFNGGARSADFLALNPMGEAPVLETPDGILTQSGSMLNHLVRRFNLYGGHGPQEEDEILRWILWDNHKLSSYAGLYRFMTNFMPPDKRSPDVIAFFNGRLNTAMKVLENHLNGQDYVAVRDRLTIADMSCCAYLYFMDEMNISPADWPAISAWLERVTALPGWRHPYEMLPGHARYAPKA